VRLIVSVV